MESSKSHSSVIIIGGGLAGLSAALRLAARGIEAVVIEKDPYPRHRVCGEYLSHEVIPYLASVGIDLSLETDINISRLLLSTQDGNTIETQLPLGAVGISRFRLDDVMYEQAKGKGVAFIFDTVTEVTSHEGEYRITTKQNGVKTASYVIAAFGKRSSLDRKMSRPFFSKNAPWIGIKAHYKMDEFPDDLVALHNFEGGYCGLSKTESGAINACYLANYKHFKKHDGIENFADQVVNKNPLLKKFFKSSSPLFENPKTIAQISFDKKSKSEDGVLMCGDSAGLIHPLCGNGMAMAIHSGKIGADLISAQLSSNTRNLKLLAHDYEKQWDSLFQKRLIAGRLLQKMLLSKSISNLAMKTVVKSPWLIRKMIQMTHGDVVL